MAITDPGQIAMIAAETTAYNYPFRVDLNDAPIVRSSVATVTIAGASIRQTCQ